jgi:hypothetical protein
MLSVLATAGLSVTGLLGLITFRALRERDDALAAACRHGALTETVVRGMYRELHDRGELPGVELAFRIEGGLVVFRNGMHVGTLPPRDLAIALAEGLGAFAHAIQSTRAV